MTIQPYTNIPQPCPKCGVSRGEMVKYKASFVKWISPDAVMEISERIEHHCQECGYMIVTLPIMVETKVNV